MENNDENASVNPRAEQYLLEVLQDIEDCANRLRVLTWGEVYPETLEDLEDDDYAKVTLWIRLLDTIVDDAEEHDVVDTLDLHPLKLPERDQ